MEVLIHLIKIIDHLEILPNEVTEAINSLKNSKAAGIDNIPAEMLKAGEEMYKVILKICNEAWKKNRTMDQINTNQIT